MKKLLLVLALVAVLPVGMAGADTIVTLKHVGNGSGVGGGFTLHYGSGYGAQTISNVFAGELLFTGLNDDGSASELYCLDLFKTLTDSETVTIRDIEDYPNDPGTTGDTQPAHTQSGVGSMIGWLLGLALEDDLTDVQAAGLQMAIWEVALENSANGYSVSAPGYGEHDLFWVSASPTSARAKGAVKAANDYLALLGTSTNALWLDVNGKTTRCGTSVNGQDFGVAYEAPVPEPASMLLLGSGLLGVGAAARRRKGAKK